MSQISRTKSTRTLIYRCVDALQGWSLQVFDHKQWNLPQTKARFSTQCNVERTHVRWVDSLIELNFFAIRSVFGFDDTRSSFAEAESLLAFSKRALRMKWTFRWSIQRSSIDSVGRTHVFLREREEIRIPKQSLILSKSSIHNHKSKIIKGLFTWEFSFFNHSL